MNLFFAIHDRCILFIYIKDNKAKEHITVDRFQSFGVVISMHTSLNFMTLISPKYFVLN